MDYKTLNNGTKIPILGLGTYRIENDKAEELVLEALDLGYRHIDTAAVYGNEEGIGRALAKTDIPREELFITSKLWNDDQGYESALAAFDSSLEKLGLDYLDLYLIHWPDKHNLESWKALEELYKSGRVKAIGLSNFHKHHIDEILEISTVKPMVNQYERHPYFQQNELYQTGLDYDLIMEAWSPIAKGKVLEDEVLEKIAEKYNKNVVQIVLRWQIQSGYVVFPKTEHLGRLKENIDIFDFELIEEDMETINSLDDENGRIGKNPDTRIQKEA